MCSAWTPAFGIVAVAGATSTGLYDDLRPISAFCGEHGIWFHVDAAHGGGALLSERHRYLLDGIEYADSVVWDAHKMLRNSGLCAAVLVRRGADLPGAFHQHAAYLIDDREAVGFDLLDRSLESTKPAIGLKLFLSLAWLGERGLGDYVASRYQLTHGFHDLVSAEPGFSCPYVPESNILCFRFDGVEALEIRERLLTNGRLHIGSTTIAGERYLRIVVMSPDTDEQTLDKLVHELRTHQAATPRSPRRIRSAIS